MLAELEDAVLARLGELKQAVPRLRLETYGGELSDPDQMVKLIAGGPSILITTPKVSFKQRTNRRYAAALVFRLVISSERERKLQAKISDPGSYLLWESCMGLLTDWQHKTDGARVRPTEFNNLVSGRFQAQSLSVLGQSFAIDLDWTVPEPDWPELKRIVLDYHVPADNPEITVTDNIELRDV
ncbi:phage protein Gp37 [Pseudomonas sp. MRSN 12121]|uniref:phage protein Gp37 n=1 Tax=Pseudomonas sp. MRSN 12121 TaxID=1611770 RepID=UPI0005BEE278|nr:phage protein Gp37 [Pseudomonas sp. MRSN 12121]AJO77486.1 lipoprotein [Pseudomonas sp. MRSN 12121]